MICCAAPKFKLVEDLGHTEGVDWDLGKCNACGAYLLRQWSEYAPNKTFYDKLSDDEANAFLKSEGVQRKSLLKQWYEDN
jgi:hypothetical protein